MIEDIIDELRRSRKRTMTKSWPEFLVAIDLERFRRQRREQLALAALGHGLIVGYGNNVVAFCLDAVP